MARSDPQEQAIQLNDPAAIGRSRNTHDSPSDRRVQSPVPLGAEAIIEPRYRSVTQASRARSGEWLLRFRPRSSVDPLTGWRGSDDPLAHVAIRFSSREAAVRFAERQGLPYEVHEPAPARRAASAQQSFDRQSTFQLCCWPTGPHALCCGNYPALREEKGDV